ncbi:MAG: peptidylprolyl isomerase [Pseudomonadota bacterium]
MRIANHKVVSIDYTLTDGQGTVIDSSNDHEPLVYIHGTGNIIPGLETALEGKQAGEQINAVIPPEQAYGMRDEARVQHLSRDVFDTDEEITVGMRFHAMSENGPQVVTVVSVEGNEVTIDANHPLAGMTLHFDVTVTDVRDASEEELSHGHVHGPGGHDH